MNVRTLIRHCVLAVVIVMLSGGSAGAAAVHFQKSFPAQGISAVHVTVSFPDVHVRVAQTANVKIAVDLTSRETEKRAAKLFAAYKPVYAVKDGVITVTSSRKHRMWPWHHASISGKVTVIVPSGVRLDVKTSSGDCDVHGDLGTAPVTADTASGDVTFDGSASSIVADTASGDVRLHVVGPAEAIKADTASGDIVVTGSAKRIAADTASGDVELHLDGTAEEIDIVTSSGDITAEGLLGNVKARTSSGDVGLSWRRLDPASHVDVATVSGDVHLVFPGKTAVNGLVRTVSGEIRSDFPGTFRDHAHRLALSSARAAATVTVATSSGDVTLKTR